jgi:outer membrane protein
MTRSRCIALAGTCLALCSLSQPALAESRIDRQTETAVPRTQNLYGIGVGVLPETSGSDEYRTMILPIINANYGERFFINALQAGAWLIDSDDRRLRLGLSAEARFGWDASKGDRTRGMTDRDFSVFVGPLLRWQTDYGTFNLQWTADASGNSRGQQFQAQYIKSLVRSPQLRLNGLVGATWNSEKFNDYYFGVRSNEVTATRPLYRAGAGVEWQAGLNGMVPVMGDHSLLFGAFVTRLSDEQYQSPISETRIQPLAYIGYSIPF